jgi:hypothetical protein
MIIRSKRIGAGVMITIPLTQTDTIREGTNNKVVSVMRSQLVDTNSCCCLLLLVNYRTCNVPSARTLLCRFYTTEFDCSLDVVVIIVLVDVVVAVAPPSCPPLMYSYVVRSYKMRTVCNNTILDDKKNNVPT